MNQVINLGKKIEKLTFDIFLYFPGNFTPKEITNIESGNADSTNNVLKNAPHTVEEACADNWAYPYSRSDAVYPNNVKASEKYWPPVKRVDNVYGDKNLQCSCPSMDEFDAPVVLKSANLA